MKGGAVPANACAYFKGSNHTTIYVFNDGCVKCEVTTKQPQIRLKEGPPDRCHGTGVSRPAKRPPKERTFVPRRALRLTLHGRARLAGGSHRQRSGWID